MTESSNFGRNMTVKAADQTVKAINKRVKSTNKTVTATNKTVKARIDPSSMKRTRR